MKESSLERIVGKQEMVYPVVSVIIPVYNVAPYVREALDSVVDQTYEKLEIIVIDDGSTDGSGEICDEYKTDPRITVIHQENRGPGSARNTGLDLATGDFIAFLDSDDAYHLSFIQTMLDTILRENCDVVVCTSIYYQPTLEPKEWGTSRSKEGLYDREQALRGLIYGKFITVVWNKLYRRELWKEIRFSEGHFFEDDEVVYSVFSLINRLYKLNHPLYFYRRRTGSTMHTISRKMAEDRKLAYDHIIAFVKKNSPEVFSETDLYIVLKSRMSTMLKFYVKGAADIRNLRSTCENLDPQKLGLRGKMAYYMIRWSPWLLKVFYPVYHPLRMLLLRFYKV